MKFCMQKSRTSNIIFSFFAEHSRWSLQLFMFPEFEFPEFEFPELRSRVWESQKSTKMLCLAPVPARKKFSIGSAILPVSYASRCAKQTIVLFFIPKKFSEQKHSQLHYEKYHSSRSWKTFSTKTRICLGVVWFYYLCLLQLFPASFSHFFAFSLLVFNKAG